ncbi:MAG: ferrous iron transport protein A [Thermoanaerobacterales bacterium]|nr:ferrous iron transport protein A [Thermoanaerobacterales bacterium]
MTLDQATRGSVIRVTAIPDPVVRAQAIRFGISEGEILTCAEVIPSGPVVVRKKRQEIALGRRLARQITVDLQGREGRVDVALRR